MKKLTECLKILNLKPGVSKKDIKKSYYSLVKKWHPDRYAQYPEMQEEAEKNTKQLIEAYEILNSLSEKELTERLTEELKEASRSTKRRSAPVFAQEYGFKEEELDDIIEGLNRYKQNKIIGQVLFYAAVVAAVLFFIYPLYNELYGPQNQGEGLVNRIMISLSKQIPRIDIGITKGEVLKIQGEPTQKSDDIWFYDKSWIKFEDGRVSSYYNDSGNLKVKKSESEEN